jgi:hypothetical protein
VQKPYPHQEDYDVRKCRNFCERFGLQLVLHTEGNGNEVLEDYFGEISARPVKIRNLKNYCRLFEREFGLYDKTVIKGCKLKRIVFVSELRYSGQRRAAVPTFNKGSLYLNTDESGDYAVSVLHHEFFHVLGNK